MKGGYEGLQVVIKDHRGLQCVTRGYKVLQEVRRDDRAFEAVTRGYRGGSCRGLKGVTKGY